MIKNRNIDSNAEIEVSKIAGGGTNTPGVVYYVDRNMGTTGDGKSWGSAFKTWTEAIAAVNADYTAGVNNAARKSKGRNRVIYIAEGWYAELPMTLTASDVHIIGVASGSHDSTVLYGVPVAGTFSGTAGGPALQLTCSNCTIENLSFYTSDPLYAAIQDGGHASDTHLSATANSYNNKIVNCNFIRDTADGELGGIDAVSNEGPVIKGCTFSTSCKDFGVRIRTNGVTNPVNVLVEGCRFTGTPIGVDDNSGHNTIVKDCIFMDDTTDRPDTIDLPVDANGSTNNAVMNCYSEFSNADISDNGTSPLAINNFQLATPA